MRLSMRSSVERYLPVVYFSLSVILVAALLPTALRPPQPPPPTTAEFSPDAPPDEDHEVILSELSRGTTTTAGGGDEVGVGDGPGGVVTEPLVELAPRRGLCFGDPPRQAESIYAPACTSAWSGDNGGATWQGVTENEVRIAVWGDEDDVGRVPVNPDEAETDEQRTLSVFQAYFNERFETYGRRIQLYVITAERREGDTSGYDHVLGPPAQSQRAAVTQADEEFKVFGLAGTGDTYISGEHEAIRRELLHIGRAWQPNHFFRTNAPFAWTFEIELEMQADMTSELVCKQMGSDPPEFNQRRDPTFNYSAPRSYGLIEYQDHVHYGIREMFEEQLGACGLEFDQVHTANFGDDQSQMATAITRMRTAGVTSIILATDVISSVVFAQEAQNSNYYPEWVHISGGRQDTNGAAGLINPSQWRHAIGITHSELPSGRTSGSDSYRAYKEMDPDNDPEGYGQLWFWSTMVMVGGIQLAGPELTPHTFQQGMQTAWPPRPPEPTWTVGGGFRPGNWAYTDYVALQWWDPDANRPGSSVPGAYRHPMYGQRFTRGEIPTQPVGFFSYDDESHITQAPEEDRM